MYPRKKIKYRTFILFVIPWIITIFSFIYVWKSEKQQNVDIFFERHYYHRTIFFVETSGKGNLDARQACAVESSTRHHFASTVQLWMFTSNKIEDNFNLTRILPNIKIIRGNLDNFFEGTPLQKWHQKGEWRTSKFRVSHLSDAVRYILIWKFGGIYLDLDIVSLKPLYGLNNFMIQERTERIAAGILGFGARHSFITYTLQQFYKLYDKDSFICVGPRLITSCFKTFCKIDYLNERFDSNCSLNALPPIIAFPVSYEEWKNYFDPSVATNVIKTMNHSLLIHVWNAVSKYERLHLGSGAAYEEAMKENCPHVYQYVLRTSINKTV